MDIYDYLKADHRQVDKLFKLFENAPDTAAKIDYMTMIAQELVIHAESEQATFYKMLEKFQTSKDEALHGEKEHVEIENLIHQIMHSTQKGKAWEKKVMDLKDLVQHHVKEEEGKIFRRAKKVLTQEDTFIIKEQMHFLKGKLLDKMGM